MADSGQKPTHEGDAVRSTRHQSHGLRRGRAGQPAPAHPQVLHEDPRRARQRRGGAALHQSREPDPERSGPAARYDQELAVSAGTTEQKIDHVVSHAVAEAGEQTDVREAIADAEPRARARGFARRRHGPGAGRPARAGAGPLHHPGLTERVATFGRSPVVTLVLCVLFGAFIAAAIMFVTPADTVSVAQQVLVWATLVLTALAVVYGVVHGVAYVRRRAVPVGSALQPQTDLAILNWRREKSVFMGTNQPQEDASWIFQLRMAELERAKSGRTSEPRPWHRLVARLFDYAIWGLSLALLLSELRGMHVVSDAVGYCAGAPAVRAGGDHGDVDPGRGAADRGARHDARQVAVRHLPAVLDLRRLRPPRHAGAAQGARCAAPSASGGRAWRAASRCSRRCWSRWPTRSSRRIRKPTGTSRRMCLVTHGPPGVIKAATGVCGLAAMLWLYGVAWHQPMADSIDWARATVADALPSAATDQGQPRRRRWHDRRHQPAGDAFDRRAEPGRRRCAGDGAAAGGAHRRRSRRAVRGAQGAGRPR